MHLNPLLVFSFKFSSLTKSRNLVILDDGGFANEEMKVLKSLPNFVQRNQNDYRWLPATQIRRLNCRKFSILCASVEAGGKNKIIFFTGIAPSLYEVFHGDVEIEEILDFGKEVVSHRLHTITPSNFQELLQD